MTYVILPELGEGIKNATVASWFVREGQSVGADDDLVDVVTDKATFSVPAGRAGVVLKILVAEGQEVNIGEKLAVLVPAG